MAESTPGTRDYRNATDYAFAVNEWLWQCYQAQMLTVSYWFTHAALIGQDGARTNIFHGQANAAVVQQQVGGREYIIPPIWKRVVAEIIDLYLFLLLKVSVIYMSQDTVQFVRGCARVFEQLMNHENMDYQEVLEVTAKIVSVEVIYRFVVSIFEALFLWKGFGGGGGCTPGKSIMHLKVVSCHTVTVIGAGVLRVYPATDLGFGWALLRTFIKNVSLPFVFPLCFTGLLFQFNRTAYDVICNTIVVEERP